MIVFEYLKVAGIVKNHNMAKSVTDASGNLIIHYTTYKAESAGKVVIPVNPTCSEIMFRVRQHQERSGTARSYIPLQLMRPDHYRDPNAAINIRNVRMIRIEKGIPKSTPVEFGGLPLSTPIAETGSTLR